MYDLRIDRDVSKQLLSYPPKQFKQVVSKILFLGKNPTPQDCKSLKHKRGYRVDQGEYRILYTVKHSKKLVIVYGVGNRNDDAVYRNLPRIKRD